MRELLLLWGSEKDSNKIAAASCLFEKDWSWTRQVQHGHRSHTHIDTHCVCCTVSVL
jgi:hypothetical protein